MHDQPHDHTNPTPDILNPRRAMLAGLGGLAAGAFLASTANAGPLTPPPGPISSTPGPEPRIPINQTNTPGDANSMFKIIAPGSYYLTGNIFGLVNKHGIKVTASGVTIDLGGFMLRGLGEIHGSFDGIFAEEGEERIIVRNGHVELMGRTGINLSGATRCVVEDVIVWLCLESGVRCGDSGRISRCTTAQNSINGISANRGAFIDACYATNNGLGGIQTQDDASIVQCVVLNSGGSRIFATFGSSILECISNGNSLDGINIRSSLVKDCTVSFNGKSGITMELSFAQNCVARRNGEDGITAEFASSVTHCRASFNGAFGVRYSSGLTSFTGGFVSECAATANDAGGISAASDARIFNNTCVGNDGAGIVITGSDNRIEGNHCTDNPIGMLVSSGGNIITRNTCAGNTIQNWSISANNYYGPIINRIGVGTAAVNGNSASGTLASTDPNANYTY